MHTLIACQQGALKWPYLHEASKSNLLKHVPTRLALQSCSLCRAHILALTTRRSKVLTPTRNYTSQSINPISVKIAHLHTLYYTKWFAKQTIKDINQIRGFRRGKNIWKKKKRLENSTGSECRRSVHVAHAADTSAKTNVPHCKRFRQ